MEKYAELNSTRCRHYNLSMNVGTSKYVVTYYTGERFNSDGSIAADITISNNKRKANSFVAGLRRQGYVGNGKF